MIFEAKLDRLVPPDWAHVDKYPLVGITLPDEGVPVVLAINWYNDFDKPVKKGDKWFIGLDPSNLGAIRGGHCLCSKPGEFHDALTWWRFYNQGQEGACVGFGTSRAATLFNRRRYDAFWTYHEAQKHGGYEGQEGAYLRDGMWVATNEGLERQVSGKDNPPALIEGFSSYHWATTAEEILAALKYPLADKLGCVPLLNSWGEDYPHIVWIPGETVNRLLAEDGEAAVPTDR